MHAFSNVASLVTCLVLLCLFSTRKCEKFEECWNTAKMNPRIFHSCLNQSKAQAQSLVSNNPLEVDLGGVRIRLEKENSEFSLKLKLSEEVGRKMKPNWKKMMPYLILPGFIMAGILPWVIPGVKMIVMGVSMVNQMVFNAALFALVRSYIFDTENEEHIVYINHGYRHKPMHKQR